MKNKDDLKRIGIFLLIAFVPTWILEIIMNCNFETVGEWLTVDKWRWTGLLLMSFPALATALTRLITKDTDENYLHLHLKGNVGCYALSAVLPVLCGLLSGLILALALGCFDLSATFDAYPPLTLFSSILQIISSAVLLAWYTFGEEYGWRAYLYPKLEKLMGRRLACIVGGIIWGIWHAPLTVRGHNFGTGYWGFPWLGVVLMIIFCICVGAFLMWITEKTKSVYPAAITHAVMNNGGQTITMIFLVTLDPNYKQGLLMNVCALSGFALIGAVYLIRIMLERTPKKSNA